MDADGAWTGSWKYQGAYADQPAIDIMVYKMIKNRIVQLHNAEMEIKSKQYQR